MFVQLRNRVIELEGRVVMLETKQEILLEAITKLREKERRKR